MLDLGSGESAEGIDAPYILCVLNADPVILPNDLTALDDNAARRTVDGLIADWHPDLRRLVAESDPASRVALLFTHRSLRYHVVRK